MSQKNFKRFYLENILDFLWRQWSALGVAGGAYAQDLWAIDPEALLVFSLPIARYEPRLFDEIIDWLVINAKWIDIQRLRAIIRNKDEKTKRLLSAAAHMVSNEAKTYSRKWRAIAELYKYNSDSKAEILFKTKEGKSHPEPRETSLTYSDYGFLRGKFILRRLSKKVPINTGCNIRFLLRGLFGIGSRAECIFFLLRYDAGHPSEVAEAIGLSVRGTQDTLIELAESGLVLTRIKGKRKIEYWLSKKRWWEFLTGMKYEDIKKPVWLNWISIFSGLRDVWDVLCEIEKPNSDYMKSSKLRQAMEEIRCKFLIRGIVTAVPPDIHTPVNKYEKEFQSFIKKVLGAKDGTDK